MKLLHQGILGKVVKVEPVEKPSKAYCQLGGWRPALGEHQKAVECCRHLPVIGLETFDPLEQTGLFGHEVPEELHRLLCCEVMDQLGFELLDEPCRLGVRWCVTTAESHAHPAKSQDGLIEFCVVFEYRLGADGHLVTRCRTRCSGQGVGPFNTAEAPCLRVRWGDGYFLCHGVYFSVQNSHLVLLPRKTGTPRGTRFRDRGETQPFGEARHGPACRRCG